MSRIGKIGRTNSRKSRRSFRSRCCVQEFHVAYYSTLERIVLCRSGTMWLESDAPATVESLGIGCATTSPNVRLAASAPAVGNPEFELQLLHAQPGTLALFGLPRSVKPPCWPVVANCTWPTPSQ